MHVHKRDEVHICIFEFREFYSTIISALQIGLMWVTDTCDTSRLQIRALSHYSSESSNLALRLLGTLIQFTGTCHTTRLAISNGISNRAQFSFI